MSKRALDEDEEVEEEAELATVPPLMIVENTGRYLGLSKDTIDIMIMMEKVMGMMGGL